MLFSLSNVIKIWKAIKADQPSVIKMCRLLMATLSSQLAVPVIAVIRWPSPLPGTQAQISTPTANSGRIRAAFIKLKAN